MRIKRLIAALILCIAINAEAATYKWVDRNGVLNLTDDPDKVPAEYMKKVRKLPSVKGGEPAVPVPQKEEGNTAGSISSDGEGELHGGHNEEWWRSSFKTINDELKGLKEKLPDKKAQTEIYRRRWRIFMSGARERVEYYKMKEDVEKDEARVTELEAQLAALQENARKAGVPAEWTK